MLQRTSRLEAMIASLATTIADARREAEAARSCVDRVLRERTDAILVAVSTPGRADASAKSEGRSVGLPDAGKARNEIFKIQQIPEEVIADAAAMGSAANAGPMPGGWFARAAEQSFIFARIVSK